MTAKKSMRKAARQTITPMPPPVEEVAQESNPPEPEAPEPEVVEESPEVETSPFGDFDLAGAIKMAQPLIDQAVADNLTKMNLPALIQAAVNEQLQPLVEAAKARMGSGNPTQAADIAETVAPVPRGNHSPMQEQLVSQGLSMLIQKILGGGGNSGGGDIAKLAETLKGVQSIAELANAPYRQGRYDALKETNETLKLLRGVGASNADINALLINATGKEVASE